MTDGELIAGAIDAQTAELSGRLEALTDAVSGLSDVLAEQLPVLSFRLLEIGQMEGRLFLVVWALVALVCAYALLRVVWWVLKLMTPI